MTLPAAPILSIGPYVVLRTLGVGSQGCVLRARHEESGEVVAIKLAGDAQSALSLEAELTLLQRLATPGHAGVIAVRAVGEHEGFPWFAMEELSCSWRDLLGASTHHAGHEAARIERAHALVLSLARALAYVHQHKIVHTDLSPGNVGLRANDEAVVIDFGGAIALGEAAAIGLHAPATPGYVAPERLRGEPWDTRADLYSVGCLWYELVTGRAVFSSDSQDGLTRQHMVANVIAPTRWMPTLPRRHERVMLALLEKAPKNRIARAAELVALLEHDGPDSTDLRVEIDSLFEPALHEREAQLSTLRSELENDERKVSSHWLVGEAGVGKSRLLSTLSKQARELGYWVIHCEGGALCGETSPAPFGLFAHLRSEERHARLSMVQAIAPITDVHATLHEEDHVGLLRRVEEAAPGQPILLAIDDAHCADAESLGFLDWLSGILTKQRIVVVATFCEEWSAAAHHLPELPRTNGVQRLTPLSLAATRAMALDMLGVEYMDDSLEAWLHMQTHGNPHEITTCLRWLRSSGSLAQGVGARRGAFLKGEPQASSWQALALPLSAEQTALAAAAATLGKTFSTHDLAELTGRTVAELESSLLGLVRGQVLRPLSRQLFRFSSELVRAAVERSVAQEKRSAWHAAHAEKLRGLPVASLLQRELGWHFSGAGMPARAAVALRKAAKKQQNERVVNESVRLMEAALQQARLAASHDSSLVMRTGLSLLMLCSQTARHEQLQRAAPEFLAAQGKSWLIAQARVHRLLALAARMAGDYQKALEHVRSGKAALDQTRVRSIAAQRERIELMSLEALVYYAARDVHSMRATIAAAMPIARRWGRDPQRAAVYILHANALALRRRYRFSTRAVAYERKALALHERAHSPSSELAMAMFEVAFMLLLGERAECEEAILWLERAAALASRLNVASLRSRIHTYLAIGCRRMRWRQRTQIYASFALADAQACGLRGYIGAAHGCLAWVEMQQGNQHGALQHTEQALQAWSESRKTDPQRATEYPFQWLALLPGLALYAADENYARCATMLDELLHHAQARLANPVDIALKRAQRAATTQHALLPQRIDECIRQAALHAYL